MPLLGFAWVGFLGTAFVAALIDPAWAVPLQTLLLIVLTIVTFKVGGNVKHANSQNDTIIAKGDEIHTDVLAAKANSTHAASAAAAAAATARDSSRIVKDVGKLFREAQATMPPTGPTGPTGPEGGS